MIIKVTDMFEAKEIASHFDLVVSIFDDRMKPLFDLGRDKHFIAKFNDTEHPSEDEFLQMQREIHTILDWIQTKYKMACQSGNREDVSLLIHCHAGISRSSAMAWLILVMTGEDPLAAFQNLFKQRPRIWPNKTVLAIGSQRLNLDPSFMQLVAQCDTEIAMSKREYLGYGG
jgi:predicted protein tyrosine phosphatase